MVFDIPPRLISMHYNWQLQQICMSVCHRCMGMIYLLSHHASFTCAMTGNCLEIMRACVCESVYEQPEDKQMSK
jgi:hypothetical protein